MTVYEVSYVIPCVLKVKATTEEEALEMAAQNPNAPFDWDGPEEDREEGIVDAAVGEACNFEVAETVAQKQTGVKAWLNP